MYIASKLGNRYICNIILLAELVVSQCYLKEYELRTLTSMPSIISIQLYFSQQKYYYSSPGIIYLDYGHLMVAVFQHLKGLYLSTTSKDSVFKHATSESVKINTVVDLERI